MILKRIGTLAAEVAVAALVASALFIALVKPAPALDAASIPTKFAIPWANSAVAPYIQTIPQASQIGITNCAASLTDGFPPLTFVPSGSGGCPPWGRDFNGILKQISQWSRWQSAGNPVVYDGTFSTAISGYPKGAMIGQAATVGCFWISSVDNNTTNPDSGGANWINGCVGSMAVGTTAVTGGVSGRVLYDNGGLLGEISTSGTGNVVLATSAGLTTPSIASPTITAAFTATGLVKNADLVNAATTVNGQTCTLGSSCTITATATTITVSSTTVSGGSGACLLYNNSGTLGCTLTPTLTSLTVTTISGGPTIAGPTITGPTISGTVAGGGTYASITLSGTATASGTVAGGTFTGSTIASPNITGTVAGGASYTAPTITSPTISGTVAGGATYSSVALTTPSIAFGTGSASTITATSANTGFANTWLVNNSGTSSNASTISNIQAALGCSNCSTTLVATGGASPSGSLTTGAGMTGGFAISAGAGTLSIASPTISSSTLSVAATVSGALNLTGVITPSSLSSNQNDWAPTSLSTANVIRASASPSVVITGLTAPASGGRTIVLQNIGTANTITLVSESASSTAANRFTLASTVVLYPGAQATLWYDTTSSRWRMVSDIPTQVISAGYKNLKIIYTTSATATLTADAITVESADGRALRLQTINVVANLGTTGANGIDTGTRSASTWYSWNVIYNPATNTTAALLSTSATCLAATLPSGYTFCARLGYMRTDASGTPLFVQSIQYGRIAQWIATATVSLPIVQNGSTGTVNAGTPSLTAISITGVVPPSASSIAVLPNTAATGTTFMIAPNSAGYSGASLGPSTRPWPATYIYSANGAIFNMVVWMVLESTSIYVALASPGGGAAMVGVLGWEDNI